MPEGNSAATDAAVRKAEELGVDLDTVEGTGFEGAIKVSDVEAAAEQLTGSGSAAEASPVEEGQADEEPAEAGSGQNRVKVLFAAELVTDRAYGPDGVLYAEGDEVYEAYFDSVLAPAEDSDGRKMFRKDGEA